jgi:hypothetical protein
MAEQQANAMKEPTAPLETPPAVAEPAAPPAPPHVLTAAEIEERKQQALAKRAEILARKAAASQLGSSEDGAHNSTTPLE